MVADLAYATSRRYRIIEITPIGIFTDFPALGIAAPPAPSVTPPRLAFNTLGINDEGMVVGGFKASNGKPHAFLWDASSATTAPVFTDMHVATFGSENGAASFANDVSNPIGSSAFPVIIVGQVDSSSTPSLNATGEAHAWLWDTTIADDALQTTAGPLSAAYAVTNEESATIVGETSLVCPISFVDYRRPFRVEGYTGSGTAPAMTLLDVNAPRTEGYSRDVTAAVSSIDAVGGADGDQAEGDRCLATSLPTPTCPFVTLAPVRWEDGTTAGTDLGVFDPMGPTGAYANGINVDRDAVGFGFLVDDEVCIKRATMWVLSDSSDPIALPDPPGGTNDLSAAEADSARNEEGCVWVVGVDESLDRAAIWFGSPDDGPSAFCVAIADDEALPCSDPEFSVYRAHDVNRWGHVAVVLEIANSSPPAFAAGVLTHVADLDGNLRVDGADLGLLLLNWCSSGCDEELVADLDCDGIVDGADSGVLLSAWSGSDFVAIEPLCTCGSSESMMTGPSSISESEWASAAESLGFPSLGALAEWGKTATKQQLDAVGSALAVLASGGES